MPEEDYEFTPSPKLMQIDEIEAIAKIFVGQGVNKIRLTGGEPLVRKGAEDIILRLAKLPVNLTLATNATRLHEFVDVLEQANVRSLNISLDTLQSEKFQLITRRNLFDRIVETINLLIDKNFHVKVNVVVMKGLNENEINDFVEWTKDRNVHVRFIEFMPFESNRCTGNKVLTWKEMLEVIEKKYGTLP
jgi:cyclic pyranopterin phosphate synthase